MMNMYNYYHHKYDIGCVIYDNIYIYTYDILCMMYDI